MKAVPKIAKGLKSKTVFIESPPSGEPNALSQQQQTIAIIPHSSL